MNTSIHVIPVIDVLDGRVVHAVAGKRDEYELLQSTLCHGCQPLDVAKALAEKVGHRQLYVADLGSLMGQQPNWSLHRALIDDGFELLLDIGITSIEDLQIVRRQVASGVRPVVGTESLYPFDQFASLCKLASGGDTVLSLDLYHGRPITPDERIQSWSPVQIARHAAEVGVKQLIVLDMATVGTRQGPSVSPICAEIRRSLPNAHLIAGGGVRGIKDLSRLKDAGCDAALSATWLHGEKMTR